MTDGPHGTHLSSSLLFDRQTTHSEHHRPFQSSSADNIVTRLSRISHIYNVQTGSQAENNHTNVIIRPWSTSRSSYMGQQEPRGLRNGPRQTRSDLIPSDGCSSSVPLGKVIYSSSFMGLKLHLCLQCRESPVALKQNSSCPLFAWIWCSVSAICVYIFYLYCSRYFWPLTSKECHCFTRFTLWKF